MIELLSGQSTRISLGAIHNGAAELNAHRIALLNKVPYIGDWCELTSGHVELKDLAYLTAKTGHEFAILSGKNIDVLFHGTHAKCDFPDILVDRLMTKQLSILCHSHPGEDVPTPSSGDRNALKIIGQKSSKLISGRTGVIIEYTADLFDDSFL